MAKKSKKRIGLVKDYAFALTALKRLFSQYSADDVASSVLASELWLPNRSSGVKHQLCWGIFASMNLVEFKSHNCINTYPQFVSFIKTLHSLLPSFPMLEDFVPQADWGEISTVFRDQTFSVFFGGNVERITDFIKAFEIEFSSEANALADMELALTIQSHFLLSIDKEIVGHRRTILAGNIGIPTEEYWLAVKSSLDRLSLNNSFSDRAKNYSIPIGSFDMPTLENSFGSSMMDGSFQKFIFIRVNDKLYPTSIRNIASIVMVFLEDFEKSNESFFAAAQSISAFTEMNAENTVPGPSVFCNRDIKPDVLFSSFLISKEVLYIPVPIRRAEIETLDDANKDLLEALKNQSSLEFWNLNINQMIRMDSSYSIENDNIRILYVIMDVSTVPSFHTHPIYPAYLISISDFVTLVSSLDSDDSLDEILFPDTTSSPLISMAGVIDLLGANKDTDSVLVEGANSPDHIFMDPHFGCDWRYKHLVKYWRNAPKYFPIKGLCWKNGSSYDNISSIYSKGKPRASWYTRINECEVHFVCAPQLDKLGLNNVRVLTLAIECFADALQQRSEMISSLPIFNEKPIFVYCEPDAGTLLPGDMGEVATNEIDGELVVDWFYPKEVEEEHTQLKILLNISNISNALHNAKDASLQASAANALLEGICRYYGAEFPANIQMSIESSASNPARMTMEVVEHTVSVPEPPYYNPPLPKHFKRARKEIAHILKSQKVTPGIYELGAAKEIIDAAKITFKQDIHKLLGKYERNDFLKCCVEHHDRLSSVHQIEKARLKQSLRHEVSYDRQAKYSESVEEFVKNSRNYRYLIEAFISLDNYGTKPASQEDILTIIGKVDWLMVLYSASDVLHNDIDVGGIRVNDDYVPEVFYSESRAKLEDAFKRHDASARLGINVNYSDKLRVTDKALFSNVQDAFLATLGFEYSLLLEVAEALSKWTTFGLRETAKYYYVQHKDVVVKHIAEALDEQNLDSVKKVLDFLTLDPLKVRFITGKNQAEGDVPVWEHTKRQQRYTIRPILELEESILLWGADAADNTYTIWLNTIHNGYLPADIEASEIDAALRAIKESMEKKLEVMAHEITSRFSPFSIAGIDFRRRFPKQQFDDVGDFDVLAYWPEQNSWLTIECKYIQPPFSIKDSRRLREKMFDRSKNKSHLCKISKRRLF